MYGSVAHVQSRDQDSEGDGERSPTVLAQEGISREGGLVSEDPCPVKGCVVPESFQPTWSSPSTRVGKEVR